MSKPVGSSTQYDESSNNFAVSPSLMLGILYDQYKSELYLRAVSTPADYAKCRSEIIDKVKIGIVTKIYRELREILCEGKMDGTPIIKIGTSSKPLVPNYPPTHADELIMNLSRGINSKLDEIIEIVIPNFSDILKNRLESKTV